MLQTILIPKVKFSLPDAVEWVRDHHYNHHKVDITDRFYRFRQHTPFKGSYYTVTLPNGIELVYENPVK
jgi:hypothetical protein